MAPAGWLSDILDSTVSTNMTYQPPQDLPVLHSSAPTQNMFSMSDSQGNRQWIGVGRAINGYKIKGADPNGKSVTVEKDGRLHIVGLQGSVPTEYKPPVQETPQIGANAYAKDPTQDLLTGTGQTSEEEQKIANQFKFDDATFSKIVENTKNSSYMTDDDKKRIIRLDDFMKKSENGELEKGKRYFIPKLFDDGNVDFDAYTPEQ